MRIRFQTSGGIAYFPGLAAPRVIDVDRLDDATRDSLTKLIRDGEFFSLPAETGTTPTAADHHTYRITVDDGARQHTVTVSDPIENPTLQRLVTLLQTLGREA
jgi:hypothetical protein